MLAEVAACGGRGEDVSVLGVVGCVGVDEGGGGEVDGVVGGVEGVFEGDACFWVGNVRLRGCG